MSTILPAKAEAIARTRKRWALDLLAHAAREHQRSEMALHHLIEKAHTYGCTHAEVEQLLRPAGEC